MTLPNNRVLLRCRVSPAVTVDLCVVLFWPITLPVIVWALSLEPREV